MEIRTRVGVCGSGAGASWMGAPAWGATVAALIQMVAAVRPAVLPAQEMNVSMEMAAEARVFPRSPLFAEQAAAAVSPSLVARPEWGLDLGGGAWRLSAEAFFRLDAHDTHRTHVDIRELGVHWAGSRATAFAGIGRVFWGVTEVHHLVDIVNQTDAVEDIDGEDKLGQPMLRLTIEGEWGAVESMVMPWFRERSYPAADARLRGALPVSAGVKYEAGQGRWHPDLAVRWYRPLGSFDVGASLFRGTAREPRLVPNAAGTALVPYYDQIDQAGLDAQWTGDATLLKLEAISRGGHTGRFWAATAGIEHTLYQILGSNGDLGLLVELMADGRSNAEPPTLFDHDAFAGVRWSANDVAGTAILGGALVDWESGETVALMEADRRMGVGWTAGLDVRLFARTEPGRPASGIRRDGFVNLRLVRYF